MGLLSAGIEVSMEARRIGSAAPAAAGGAAEAGEAQIDAFERNFDTAPERWAFHDSPDPATRYTRDRRLRVALDRLGEVCGDDLSGWSALVTCAGAGGEATYLANRGLHHVTASDFSPRALEHCRRRDPRLATLCLDAEQLEVADASYDLVLVQDGLHHLPRPVLGLTEMLRVARRAVVVIEPHEGLVTRWLGREWERNGAAVNWVFRWDERMLLQTVRSYLLERPCSVEDVRFWDYTPLLYRLKQRLGSMERAWWAQRAIYRVLNWAGPVRRLGNAMVAVIVKDPTLERHGPVTRDLFV
jgi:SAM-dependent methyltransferase